MASDSETCVRSLSNSKYNSSSPDSSSSDQTQNEMAFTSYVQPYTDEPLASESDEDINDEADADGLTAANLEARCEGEMPLREWYVNFISCII